MGLVVAWRALAIVRGVGLAVLWCWVSSREMEYMLSGAWIGRSGPLLLLVLANLAIGAVEVALAVAWLVRKFLSGRASVWDCLFVPVFAAAAAVPFAGYALFSSDNEQEFLVRHHDALERALRTGEPQGEWDVWRDGERTILWLGPWGVTDSYFLIHDPHPGGELSDEPFRTHSFEQYRELIHSIKGPWHSAIL